jgi:environmental stress-induced protein Ves
MHQRLNKDLGREHFRTDSTIRAFWKLPDDQRRSIWENRGAVTTEINFSPARASARAAKFHPSPAQSPIQINR